MESSRHPTKAPPPPETPEPPIFPHRPRTNTVSTNRENFFSSTLQSQVLSIVLGNLLTIAILIILYFNLLVFGHYGSEMIYAVLLSEALLNTRNRMLEGLSYYTKSDSDFSPRELVFNFFSSFSGFSFLCFIIGLLVFLFSSLAEPLLIVFSTCWILALSDRASLFLFRLHHLFQISDELLVSLFICFVLVSCVAVFIGSFLLLAVRDMTLALDGFAVYVNEHVLKDETLRSKFNESLLMSKVHIDNLAGSLSHEGTPYRFAMRLTAEVISNLTRKLEGDTMINIWDDSLMDRVKEGLLSLSNSTVLPQAAGVLLNPVYVGIWFFLSVGVAFLDFGVRASFFAGLLVFLVANPKSVLNTVMESIQSVFKLDDERAVKFRLFEDELRSTFQAVFQVPISLAAAHAIATLSLFFSFNLVLNANLSLSYFAALLSLFLTLMPFVSPFASCLPWCVVSSMFHSNHWIAFFLLFSQYTLFQLIDAKMISSLHDMRAKAELQSYLTGLSFFFGITSMGLHGVVLGPLCVSFFYTTVNNVLAQYRDVLKKERGESV